MTSPAKPKKGKHAKVLKGSGKKQKEASAPASPPPEEKVEPSKKLFDSLHSFLNDVECAKEMFDAITPILKAKDQERESTTKKLMEEMKERTEARKLSVEWLLDHLSKFNKTTKSIRRADVLFRQHSIVLLVSRLDEFIADLLRISFQAFPERLKGNAKTLTYEELLGASSIEEVFLRFVEKEIDRLLRDSQDDIIAYLDEHFKIGIRDHFANYDAFLELTERRNLFVHTGGVVTHQYLSKCTKFYSTQKTLPKAGDHLEVSTEYHTKATEMFLEIGLRIGQGVARRIFPGNLEDADVALNRYGYDLLIAENWLAAKIVFQFARTIPDKLTSKEEFRRIFLINLAIAYKWGGEASKSMELLNSVDWSACSPKFLIAEAALREDFKAAAKIMSGVPIEAISDYNYRTWPVFRDFRKSPEFSKTYKLMFKEDFMPQLVSESLDSTVASGTPPTTTK